MNKIHEQKNGYILSNTDFDGVELYFNIAPDVSIRDDLREKKWRYHRKKHCWYNRLSEENVDDAKKFLLMDANDNEYDIVISVGDVVVTTAILSCIHRNHIIEKANAIITILTSDSTAETIVPVCYCQECDVFYMDYVDYEDIVRIGVPCCKVFKRDDYSSSSNVYELAPYSIMRSYGYTVNMKDNMSAQERRRILSFLVENNVLSATRINEYLSWFIRTAKNRAGMTEAINKWRDDKNFISQYMGGDRSVKVRQLFLK